MKNKKKYLLYPIFVLAFLGLYSNYGCKKEFTDIPTVETNEVIPTSDSTANGGGRVTDDGGLQLTARGVCWCKAGHAPTTADPRTFDGAQIGSYVSKIKGLEPGVNYNVRAYASNMNGTTYGNTVSFKIGP